MDEWGILLESVGFADIDRAVARWHARGCSRLTIRGYVQRLRSFLRFAEHRGWCAPGLVDGIMPPRFHPGEAVPKGLNRDEVLRLLKTSEGDRPTDVRDRAILMVLIAYGLRSAEVTGLQLDDLDLAGEILRVRRPKQGRSHHYPLSRGIGQVIVRYITEVRPRRPERALFLTLTAPIRPLGRAAIYGVVRTRLDRIGVTGKRRGPARAAPCCRPVPARPRSLVQRDRRLPRPPQYLLHCGLRQGATQRAARGRRHRPGGSRMTAPGCGQRLHHLAPGTRREVRRQCHASCTGSATTSAGTSDATPSPEKTFSTFLPATFRLPSTRSHKYGALAGFYSYAISRGHIVRSPLPGTRG